MKGKKANIKLIAGLGIIVIAIVVFVATLGIGGDVISDIGTGSSTNGTVFNVTNDGNETLENMSEKAPLLTTIVILGVILALIGGLLYYRNR